MSGGPAFDRSRPPAVTAPPRAFEFPPFSHSRLANGLRIFAARLDRVPLVSLQMLIPAAGHFDPPHQPGLASLHGGLLDEGTTGMSSLEIAGRIEALGGSLTSGAGWNMAYVEAGMLSRHLASGLDLLAEVVRSPAFPEREIDRLRKQRSAEILRRRGHPGSLAEQEFAAAVYGDTVYGKPLIGTEESLGQLDREHLRAFNRHHVGPRGSTLVVVGDLDPDQLTDRATAIFGDWRDVPLPGAPVIEAPQRAVTEVRIVDRPGGAQTQLQLGHAGVPRKHPGYPQRAVLNTIFGGKFTSRINLNLREKHGYTYGAQSVFTRRRGPGPFVLRAAVATDVAGAAVGELLLEMRRIRDEPVSVEELEETQDYLVGVFPYTLQTIDDLSSRLEALAVFDLPLDYYESFPAVLGRVTREEILAAARECLHPDRLTIVAVGPAESLRPQLETYGPVTVIEP